MFGSFVAPWGGGGGGGGGAGAGGGGAREALREGGEMTQTLSAHMNKKINKIKKEKKHKT
jgi:hypothetical protein